MGAPTRRDATLSGSQALRLSGFRLELALNLNLNLSLVPVVQMSFQRLSSGLTGQGLGIGPA